MSTSLSTFKMKLLSKCKILRTISTRHTITTDAAKGRMEKKDEQELDASHDGHVPVQQNRVGHVFPAGVEGLLAKLRSIVQA